MKLAIFSAIMAFLLVKLDKWTGWKYPSVPLLVFLFCLMASLSALITIIN